MGINGDDRVGASETGQVSRSAAEVYEEFFVPALFAEWTDRVLDSVGDGRGIRALDVACGTGVLTRAAAQKFGNATRVVGLDINEGMLAIARRSAPNITWRLGAAEDLPFDDNSFDCVVSQFGLMFFNDPVMALREMARVLRDGRRLAVAVWDALERTPGYWCMVQLLERLFGDDVANGLRAPFVMGDTEALLGLFRKAGLGDVAITTYTGTAQFPSLASWMYTDIRGWTLADSIDDTQFAMLLSEAQQELAEFVQEDGTVRFASPAHIVTAIG